MSAPLIPLDAPFDEPLVEASFTIGELQSHPLAAPFTPQFEAFLVDWQAANAIRIGLVIAVGKAEGALNGADDALDDFVDLLDRTLLIILKNDRTAALYLFYFGAKAASLLKRPILGEQLSTVRGFLQSIQTSPIAALAALAPVLVAVLAKADAAVSNLQKAQQALKEFDTIGGKKTLIDAFNGLRQKVHGELAAIPHAHPAEMLPADFADRFFRHESHKGVTSLKNPKEVQARIDSLQKKLETAKMHLEALNDRAAQKAAAKVAEQEAEAALAKGREEKKAADQKVKDLEKQLEEAKKKG